MELQSHDQAFFSAHLHQFGDTIPTLVSRVADKERSHHEKAAILADNWEQVFNETAERKEDIEEYVVKHKDKWKQVDLSAIDDEITNEEVEASIRHCKRGKACGPDDLSNEWYQDHTDLIVPVLTRVLNDCYSSGEVPMSFGQHISSA